MAQNCRSDQSAPPRWRTLWVVLSVSALLAILLWLDGLEDTADITIGSAEPTAPVVSVIEVDRAVARASISVFAELKPRWDAQIRSAVTGRIVEVHNAALAGTRVQAGTPLLTIQRAQYETTVAQAEVALEEARLALLQAENRVTIAKSQFQRDATAPPNELALNLPQLKIAERRLTFAEIQLQAARRQLADTEVTAPFSGFVTQRMASLGQTVSAGDPLLHLSDDQQFELVADLSQAEWSMLAQPVSGTQARLLHRNGDILGRARVRQGGGFLDPGTRQMRVFLDVSGSEVSALSGDFLQVSLTGRTLENTLTLPDSALTRGGHVWFVGDGNLLKRLSPKVLFRSEGRFTIAAPEGDGPWNVAKSPLASFLPGQRVTPMQSEE